MGGEFGSNRLKERERRERMERREERGEKREGEERERGDEKVGHTCHVDSMSAHNSHFNTI